jgi:hypothetical protein
VVLGDVVGHFGVVPEDLAEQVGDGGRGQACEDRADRPVEVQEQVASPGQDNVKIAGG